MAAFLSQALAPVVQACRALGQRSADSPSQGKSKSVKGIPEIDYPVPLVIKNTFIDEDVNHPLGLEGFYLKREIHSTPVSAVEGAAGPREVSFGPLVDAKHRAGRSSEPDGSSSCRSTSAGSSSGRSGTDESPSSQSEVSPRDAEPCSPLDQLSAVASRARSSAGLPDFEYPAPIFVKNTFLNLDLGRPLSMDGCYEERQLHSCPGSAFYPSPDAELPGDASRAAADLADFQGHEGSGCHFFGSTPDCSPVLPHCAPVGLPMLIPLPPMEPPLLPADLSGDEAPCPAAPELPPALHGAAWAPEGPLLLMSNALEAPRLEMREPLPVLPATAFAPKAPVLLLSNALEASALGSPAALPSVGSGSHHLGACKPCAHAYTAKGCQNGFQCTFCHLCPPGELKRQQKAKRSAQRKMREV